MEEEAGAHFRDENILLWIFSPWLSAKLGYYTCLLSGRNYIKWNWRLKVCVQHWTLHFPLSLPCSYRAGSIYSRNTWWKYLECTNVWEGNIIFSAFLLSLWPTPCHQGWSQPLTLLPKQWILLSAPTCHLYSHVIQPHHSMLGPNVSAWLFAVHQNH